MNRIRPTVILVVAILQITGGSLGLISVASAGAMQLLGAGELFGVGNVQVPPGAQNKEIEEFQDFQRKMQDFQRNPPGGTGIVYAGLAINTVLGGMMLASGIGLLSMQSWARVLSIVYAFLSIANHIFQAIFALLVTIPALEVFINGLPKGNPALRMMRGVMSASVWSGLVASALLTAYPIAVLIVMLLPKSAAAFRGVSSGDAFDDDRHSFYDELDPRELGEADRPGGRPTSD